MRQSCPKDYAGQQLVNLGVSCVFKLHDTPETSTLVLDIL